MKTFFPLFDYLLKKDVKVFVLTRKSEEQDGLMKDYAVEAIEQMDSMGVVVLQFKGMVHRKLAIIDREITWEGSLNILSQRETQEFMRRFVGKHTAKQVMGFLKLERNIGAMGENQLEKCEFCREPGALYWTDKSIFGMWTFCLVGMHGKGKVPKTKAELAEKKKKVAKARKSKKEYTSDGTPICPEHELPMVKKEGHWGNFWGCQKYPRCRITEKIK
jgi:ssDNA-binding Zn-finger/Zn-ribbon topoisomerase 1